MGQSNNLAIFPSPYKVQFFNVERNDLEKMMMNDIQYASDGPMVDLLKGGQVFASLLGRLAFGKNIGIPGLNENIKIKLVCMSTRGELWG